MIQANSVQLPLILNQLYRYECLRFPQPKLYCHSKQRKSPVRTKCNNNQNENMDLFSNIDKPNKQTTIFPNHLEYKALR